MLGVRVYCMLDSKFDDKPRNLLRELAKRVLLYPYHGGLAAGSRSRDYLRVLGLKPDRIALHYDSVSTDRIRREAEIPPAPDGPDYGLRHFTVVSRLVPKKNLHIAMAAYTRYADMSRDAAQALRPIVICGSGPEEAALRLEATRKNLTGVEFRGFLQSREIARILASSLALILPSLEEQWGLVVNEALAMGVPILCSDNVGARDLLVRAGVNGYIFGPSEAEGLAYVMSRLARDREEWNRLALGSRQVAAEGDVERFAEAVEGLINGRCFDY